MLRRHRKIRLRLRKLEDAGLFTIGFWMAHLIRSDLPNWFPSLDGLYAFDVNYIWYLFLIFPLVPLCLEVHGFYNTSLLQNRGSRLWQLVKGACFAGIVVIFVNFVVRDDNIARSVVILFPFVGATLVWLKEELLRFWFHSKSAAAQVKKRVILVGNQQDLIEQEEELSRKSFGDLEVVSSFNLNESSSMKEFVDLVHKHSVNAVLINAGHTYFGKVEEAINACEIEGVEVWLTADFFKTQISKTTIDELFGQPILVFHSAPEESWQAVAKQIIDFLGALLLIVVSSPFLMVIALMVKFTTQGDILFRQQRSGLNGKPFTMLKFRSMINNAEQQKAELEACNEMSGPVFKVTEDPRITPIGFFLRKHSIDELPQLFNVLTGHMSLVGPRPLPVYEVAQFDDMAHRRRLSVRPGLTCLWQVAGRNNVKNFEDWVRLDLEYIDNWSLWLDFKILLRTIPIVLLGTGAK